jgi:hypothetical protein
LTVFVIKKTCPKYIARDIWQNTSSKPLKYQNEIIGASG